MRITKRQLQHLIKEACGLQKDDELPPAPPVLDVPDVDGLSPETSQAPAESPVNVPVPEDYQATRNFLDQNPDMVDMALQSIMQAVGAGCERSTAQAVVDHMQDLLSGSDDASVAGELERGMMGLMGL